jgi:RNA polymerase-binding transcription factor DksA
MSHGTPTTVSMQRATQRYRGLMEPGAQDYEAVLSDATRTLDDVDRSLERLDAGTYGTCEVCGEPIDDVRLAGRPTVSTCAQHQPPEAITG